MFVVVPRSDRLRSAVEETIQNLYWKRYGAVLPSFADTIVADIENRTVACAAGLRFGSEAFLSESYLDQPIEELLQEQTSERVRRTHLAEVCHLVSAGPNRSIPFVSCVIKLLAEQRMDWAVFTATGSLRKLLHRSGIAMLELGHATRSRLARPDVWGSYFEHDPRVMAVSNHDVPDRAPRPQSFKPVQLAIDAHLL